MILKPSASDLKVIGLHTGRIVLGVGMLMGIPLVVSIAAREWDPAQDFATGMCACLVVGVLMRTTCRTTRDPTWSQGMALVGLSWILATVLGAIPSWLSGHYGSFLDAEFDVMSGFTTTGLVLIQDMDHVSIGLNMWRHILTYAGGQGIIVIALTFLFRGSPGAYRMYAGEAKDERLLPNVARTAKAIWLVSLVYLVVGTLALWAVVVAGGMTPGRGLLHALWIFMSSWSTGGFAPQSYGAYYYHSLAFEIVSTVLFVSGSLNFALHWAAWTGQRKEVLRNIETISFVIAFTLAMLVTSVGLMRMDVYPDLMAFFRKAFFQVISAHTTTGLMTVYARSFVRQWGPAAMLGLVMAMAIGASACSTAGGIKGIRVGLIVAWLYQGILRLLAPENARISVKWHHVTDRVLEDAAVNPAMMIALCYVVTYGMGTVVGVLCGYPPMDAAFDSVSAGSNSGLSCGVTGPSMPWILKIVYLLEMWAGRLECTSLFALAGYPRTLLGRR